jgi:hypothetical protein
MDNINEIQTQMKIELTNNKLTDFTSTLVDYIKIQPDVDRLHDLNITQQEMFKTELELIKKFSKL